MYERHHMQPLTTGRFIKRIADHGCVALVVIAASLLAGMLGYHHFEKLPWIDAFLNAAMILGGMGPVDIKLSDSGKLFAGLYALYSGVVFIAVMGLMLAPVVHRVLHKFHWEDAHSPK